MRRSTRWRRLLAAGRLYVDRDDLDVAIGDALNDGRFSYRSASIGPKKIAIQLSIGSRSEPAARA